MLGIISDSLASYLYVFQKIDFTDLISDPVSENSKPLWCSNSTTRWSLIEIWTLLNMGGADLSNAFGMKQIGCREVFHLDWKKYFFHIGKYWALGL